MRTQNFQNKVDVIIDKVFLWAIPRWVQPNWLSYLRIFTVPVIGLLLYDGQIKSALILFVLSASTDFLDGAMARRRNQITDLGKVLDPIADKMLIATILIYMGFEYLIVKVFLIFILFEIISIITGSVLAYKIGRPVGANFFGKVKMILQSFSVGLFLLGVALNQNSLIQLAEVLLIAALFFAILAGIKSYKSKSDSIKEHFSKLIRSI